MPRFILPAVLTVCSLLFTFSAQADDFHHRHWTSESRRDDDRNRRDNGYWEHDRWNRGRDSWRNDRRYGDEGRRWAYQPGWYERPSVYAYPQSYYYCPDRGHLSRGYPGGNFQGSLLISVPLR
jgi:hypothetical protein